MTDAPGGDNRISISDDRSLNGSSGKGGLSSRRPELSPREQQVADLAVQGESNAEIAAQLGLSLHRVHTLLSRVYAKFDIRGRYDLIALYFAGEVQQAAITRRLLEYVAR